VFFWLKLYLLHFTL